MRLVCLSAESADICAQLGAWEEVVAVSAYASQKGLPARPVIGGFSHVDCGRIAALDPDLVITFSDVQADITAQLIRAGCAVLATNQRTLAEIGQTIRLIAGAIGRTSDGARLADDFDRQLAALRVTGGLQPRVYFEEWPEPMISGIGWVGELIEWCGGIDIFADRRGRAARDRTLKPAEVLAAQPDIMIASWCGKRVDLAAIRYRPGFDALPALENDQLHAMDSGIILQPGPRLLLGARELHRIFEPWRRQNRAAE